MISVSREQFVDVGLLGVRHIPTGNSYSTYRYEQPTDTIDVKVHSSGRDRDAAGNDYDLDDVHRVAGQMLIEMVARLREAHPPKA